jgi:hypothetical protein
MTSAPFLAVVLTLRPDSCRQFLVENKLAEACTSRTDGRHQRCRPPVLKIPRWVLTDFENSLLYSIFAAFQEPGSDRFCFVLIRLGHGSITFLSRPINHTLQSNLLRSSFGVAL